MKKLFLSHTIAATFLMAMLLLAGYSFGQAPTVNYGGQQSYIIGAAITPLVPTGSGVAAPAYSAPVVTGSGLNQPFGVAIDGFGNVYVADAGNNAIKKIPVGGGAPVSLGSGFNNPKGIAFKAGNLYIADYGNNAVKKMPIAGGTPTTLATGLNSPEGISLDVAGNVYVTCVGDNSVKEILVADGTVVTVATGFNAPAALTIDAYGNVYVADSGNNQVQKIPAMGGSWVTIGQGFSNPLGVAVDASGNVYVADSGNNHVKKIYASGGTPVVVASNFTPYGVIVDNVGNIYSVDYTHAVVKETKPAGGYYIHPALPRGLTMDNATGTISGKPILLQAATTYTVTAYNSTGSVTATLSIAISPIAKPNISYPSPQSYVLDKAITPLAPTYSGGGVPSPSITNIASGFNGPTGVAVDIAGNVYVADDANNAVEEIPAKTTTKITIGSGFNGPTGVAVDASGNVYVADYGNNAVKEILTSGVILTLGSGFSHPYGVAVDAAGNIYVGDSGNNAVKKMPAGGGTPIAIGTGIISPKGVAVDASGNVYVADFGNGYIKEITAAGGTTITLSPNLGAPYGVAVDAGGQVYYADANGTSTVFILPKGGGTPIAIGSSLKNAAGVATDQYGFVYVDDTGNNVVRKISVGGYYVYQNLPPQLSLNKATGVITGFPTAAAPATNYSVVAFNSSGRDTAVFNITITAASQPVISYSTPQVFTAGTVITPLTPTNTGAAVPVQTSTVVGSSLENPVGVAVDAAGNIFVSQNDVNYGIVKIPAGGGSPVKLAPTNNPFGLGIATDGSGNLYLARASNTAQVVKIPAGSFIGTPIGSNFTSPVAVAADAAGNVYVADVTASVIIEIPAGGGAPISLGSGFSDPTGVAVDAAGNVYVADNGNLALKEIPAGGGSPITLATDINGVISVAVDALGFVYFGDSYSVTKVSPGGGSATRLPYNFYFPKGIAVDSANDLFVANSNTTEANVVEINAGGYNVSPALPAGLAFNATTGAISGTPLASSPATNYTVTALGSGGGFSRCIINIQVNAASVPVISYTTPNDYTVGTDISPLSPTNTGGAVATINPVTVASPAGLAFAIDAEGNYYTAQTASGGNVNTILKIPANGGPTVTVERLTTINETIKGVAVDAAGNVFFTTFNRGYIYEVPVSGGAVITLANVAKPFGIAVDPSGNIYVASTTGNSVYQIPPGGGTPVSIGSGFANPTSLCTDATGNLFITDRGHNTIKEMPAGGGGPLTLTKGVGNGVAVDGQGNIYFVNSAGSVSRFSAIWGTMVYASGFNLIDGLAADSKGDVFVCDYGTGVIKEITPGGYFVNPALPPGLSLDVNTGIISGTPATNSPTTFYTVTGYNTGGHGSTTVSITVGPLSGVATLAHFGISKGILAPTFNSSTTSYTTTVSNTITSIAVTPTTSDPHATVTVNGTAVTSGTASGALPLSLGPNVITTVVTAQDGTTTQTYTLTVNRAASNNAKLARLLISRGVLSPAFNSATTSYAAGVGNPITSITVTPTTAFAGATVTVNGTAVTSGTASAPVALATGANTVTTAVTAQDGTTIMTYTVTITRAGGSLNTVYQPVSVERPLNEPQIQDDGIIVHQGLSPNGDGINDFLLIDGITNHPDNKLQIMNRNGQLVFEANGYDNSTKVFDGHSNKNGQMQLPGTYFYSLEYTVKGEIKHKTGFIILKY